MAVWPAVWRRNMGRMCAWWRCLQRGKVTRGLSAHGAKDCGVEEESEDKVSVCAHEQ